MCNRPGGDEAGLRLESIVLRALEATSDSATHDEL